MKAIILAAGQGIRLGNGLSELPKCLLKIGNKTIIEKQLESLSSAGIEEISIVVGAKGECWTQESFDMINHLCENIVINFDNSITCNTVSAYLALRGCQKDDIMILDGDVVYERKLLNKILSSSYENIIVAKIAESRKEIGCRLIKTHSSDDKLKNIGKNIIGIDFPWYIHSGIFKVGINSFEYFFKKLSDNKFFNEELDAPLREFIENDEIYILSTPAEEWVNINTQQDLKKAVELFSK